MTKFLRNSLALSCFLIFGAPGSAESPSSGVADVGPTIRVRVYDYAQVPRSPLVAAERHIKKIFAKAGIGLLWLDCHVPNVPKDPACDRSLQPDELVLRIIRRSRAVRVPFRRSTCGVTMLPENGGGGTYTTVFYDGLREVAEALREPHSLVLGHTVAHELGHLLLASRRHSPQGIMRAVLEPKDWQRAGMGDLLFTVQQAQELRAAVLARSAQ